MVESLTPPDEAPIFVVGTGRCGSTFIQTSLSATGAVWVWGEHAGMLQGLLRWSRDMRHKRPLREFVFPFAGRDPVSKLRDPDASAEWEVSWLNNLAEEDFTELERIAIRHLLARRLPPGKTRWGFKEILYGEDDGMLERLLEIFPAARLVHMVRHPLDTVESMLTEWQPQLLRRAMANSAPGPVLDAYAEALRRWDRLTRRLLALSDAHPRAQSFRIEDGAPMLEAVARFLALDPAALVAAAGQGGVRHGHDRSAAERAADPRTPLFLAGREAHAGLVAPLSQRLGYELDVLLAGGSPA